MIFRHDIFQAIFPYSYARAIIPESDIPDQYSLGNIDNISQQSHFDQTIVSTATMVSDQQHYSPTNRLSIQQWYRDQQ
jgi:hypothetical protein